MGKYLVSLALLCTISDISAWFYIGKRSVRPVAKIRGGFSSDDRQSSSEFETDEFGVATTNENETTSNALFEVDKADEGTSTNHSDQEVMEDYGEEFIQVEHVLDSDFHQQSEEKSFSSEVESCDDLIVNINTEESASLFIPSLDQLNEVVNIDDEGMRSKGRDLSSVDSDDAFNSEINFDIQLESKAPEKEDIDANHILKSIKAVDENEVDQKVENEYDGFGSDLSDDEEVIGENGVILTGIDHIDVDFVCSSDEDGFDSHDDEGEVNPDFDSPVMMSLTQEEEDAIQAQEEAFPDVHTDFFNDDGNSDATAIDDDFNKEKEEDVNDGYYLHPTDAQYDEVDSDTPTRFDIAKEENSSARMVAQPAETNFVKNELDDNAVEVIDENDLYATKSFDIYDIQDSPCHHDVTLDSDGDGDGDGDGIDYLKFGKNDTKVDMINEYSTSHHIDDIRPLYDELPSNNKFNDRCQEYDEENDVVNSIHSEQDINFSTIIDDGLDFLDTTTETSGDSDLLFDSDINEESDTFQRDFDVNGGIEMTDFYPTGSDSAAFVDRMDLADAYDHDKDVEGSDAEIIETTENVGQILEEIPDLVENLQNTCKEESEADAIMAAEIAEEILEETRDLETPQNIEGLDSCTIAVAETTESVTDKMQEFDAIKNTSVGEENVRIDDELSGELPDPCTLSITIARTEIKSEGKAIEKKVKTELGSPMNKTEASIQNGDFALDNAIKKILRCKLGYSSVEIENMKASVSSVLARKMFKRPKAGLSSDFFVNEIIPSENGEKRRRNWIRVPSLRVQAFRKNDMQRTLCQLGYSKHEIQAIKPEVGEILVRKMFKSPQNGPLPEMFADGMVPEEKRLFGERVNFCIFTAFASGSLFTLMACNK